MKRIIIVMSVLTVLTLIETQAEAQCCLGSLFSGFLGGGCSGGSYGYAVTCQPSYQPSCYPAYQPMYQHPYQSTYPSYQGTPVPINHHPLQPINNLPGLAPPTQPPPAPTTGAPPTQPPPAPSTGISYPPTPTTGTPPPPAPTAPTQTPPPPGTGASNSTPTTSGNTTVVVVTSDPYGFIGWLNATRASYRLPPVSYDPNLAAWAAQNNAYGYGHFVQGPAKRQNAAMGTNDAGAVGKAWMDSPSHRATLLDPTISRVGIASTGWIWTLNTY